MMDRSQLNSFRATTGLGQGSVRNANVRSNDKMGGYNSFPMQDSNPDMTKPAFENPGLSASPPLSNAPPMQGGPVIPRFGPGQGGTPANGGGLSPYNQFANRWAARGGAAGTRPMIAPQNPMFANRRRQVPPLAQPPQWGGGGTIDLPPPDQM